MQKGYIRSKQGIIAISLDPKFQFQQKKFDFFLSQICLESVFLVQSRAKEHDHQIQYIRIRLATNLHFKEKVQMEEWPSG